VEASAAPSAIGSGVNGALRFFTPAAEAAVDESSFLNGLHSWRRLPTVELRPDGLGEPQILNLEVAGGVLLVHKPKLLRLEEL